MILKQGKKLTREQKIIVSNNGLVATNWSFVEMENEDTMVIVNKTSNTIKRINIHKKKR